MRSHVDAAAAVDEEEVRGGEAREAKSIAERVCIGICVRSHSIRLILLFLSCSFA